MIMPCMNSTSACDLDGSSAVADEGSCLLGLPGAPGWTITGFAGPVCARAAEQKKPVRALVARNKLSPRPHNSANACAGRDLLWRGKRGPPQFRILLNIFILSP